MDGTASTTVFQVGANSTQTITVNFDDLQTLIGGTLGAASAAQASIALVDTALGTINSDRATYGAGINQLEHAVDNLTNVR